MSYSACDFLESCDQIAADYDAPEVTREEWNELSGEDIDEDEWEDYCEGEDGQRVLAERIGRAVSQRKDLSSLVGTIARMQTETEMQENGGDGMSGDDAVSTLSDLIEQARAIVNEVQP